MKWTDGNLGTQNFGEVLILRGFLKECTVKLIKREEKPRKVIVRLRSSVFNGFSTNKACRFFSCSRLVLFGQNSI